MPNLLSFFSKPSNIPIYTSVTCASITGILLKLFNTNASHLFDYKSAELCRKGFPVPVIREIEEIGNFIIKISENYSLATPLATKLLLGIVIIGLGSAMKHREKNIRQFFITCSGAEKNFLRSLVYNLKPSGLTQLITIIAVTPIVKVAVDAINQKYPFDSSGHWIFAMGILFINKIIDDATQQMDEKEFNKHLISIVNYAFSWISALLLTLALVLTTQQCHTTPEVLAGIGTALLVLCFSSLTKSSTEFTINKIKKCRNNSNKDETTPLTLHA